MNQTQVQQHREALTYIPLLQTPYRIYAALIRYMGFIDSGQVWSKLIKYISILKVATLEQVIEVMIEGQQYGSMEAINTRWGVLSVLAILVIIWLRLGGNTSKDINSHFREVAVSFSVSRKSQAAELNVQFKGSHKLHKKDISKILYHTILAQCEKYGLRLEIDELSGKCFLISLDKLSLEGIQYPYVLQVARDKQNPRLLLRREKKEKRKVALNVQQYVSLLKYIRRLPNMTFDRDIYSFLEFYCQKNKQILQKNRNTGQFYFKINPKDIIVIENNKDFELEIDLPLLKQYSFDQNNIPSAWLSSVFSDHRPSRTLKWMDYWSSSLTLLSLVGRYPSPQYFQNLLSGVKEKEWNQFITRQISKVEAERQFDSQSVMKFLKAWNEFKPQKRMEKGQSIKSINKERYNDTPDLSWIESALLKSRGQGKKQFGFPLIRPQRQKDKNTDINRLLDDINFPSKNSAPSNQVVKEYSIQYMYNPNDYQAPADKGQSARKKEIILGGKTIETDLNFPNSKTWTIPQLCHNTQRQYDQVQTKIKNNGIGSLSSLDLKYNIMSLSTINTQKHIEGIKQVKTQEGNRLIYCHHCYKYLCLACCGSYHGNISCEILKKNEKFLNGTLQKRLGALKKKKRPINQVALSKFVKQLNISLFRSTGDIQKIHELIALLESCFLHKQARQKFTDMFTRDEITLAVQQVLFILEMHINTLSTVFEKLGFRTEIQIKEQAQKNRAICRDLMEIYNCRQAYLLCLK